MSQATAPPSLLQRLEPRSNTSYPIIMLPFRHKKREHRDLQHGVQTSSSREPERSTRSPGQVASEKTYTQPIVSEEVCKTS